MADNNDIHRRPRTRRRGTAARHGRASRGELFDGTVQHAGDAPGGEGVPRQPAPGQRVDQDRASSSIGGNQKPWKQKGTGRARQGSTRAPHWVGGGTVFGPIAAQLRRSTCRARCARSRARARSTRARARTRSSSSTRSTTTRRRRSAHARSSSALGVDGQEGADPHGRREARTCS